MGNALLTPYGDNFYIHAQTVHEGLRELEEPKILRHFYAMLKDLPMHSGNDLCSECLKPCEAQSKNQVNATCNVPASHCHGAGVI